MTEYEAVKKQHEETLKKNYRADFQPPGKFDDHQEVLLVTLKEFESLSDRHLRLIKVAKHQVEFLNDDASRVHSVTLRVGLTARSSTAAKIAQSITRRVIEPGTTI